jgi:hypothetical protein
MNRLGFISISHPSACAGVTNTHILALTCRRLFTASITLFGL